MLVSNGMGLAPCTSSVQGAANNSEISDQHDLVTVTGTGGAGLQSWISVIPVTARGKGRAGLQCKKERSRL